MYLRSAGIFVTAGLLIRGQVRIRPVFDGSSHHRYGYTSFTPIDVKLRVCNFIVTYVVYAPLKTFYCYRLIGTS